MQRPPQRPGGRPLSSKPLSSPYQRYHRLCLDAKNFFDAKDYDTALRIYEKALTEAPAGDATALKGICRCTRKQARKALKKGNTLEVQKLLEALFKRPRIAPLLGGKDYQVLAEAALENGDLVCCAEALRQALAIKPELAEELHNLQKRLRTEQLHQDMRDMRF